VSNAHPHDLLCIISTKMMLEWPGTAIPLTLPTQTSCIPDSCKASQNEHNQLLLSLGIAYRGGNQTVPK